MMKYIAQIDPLTALECAITVVSAVIAAFVFTGIAP